MLHTLDVLYSQQRIYQKLKSVLLNYCKACIQLETNNRNSNYLPLFNSEGFLDGSVIKYLPANSGDTGSIPGWGKSPGEGNGNPLQYSQLENSMERIRVGYIVLGSQRVGHN